MALSRKLVGPKKRGRPATGRDPHFGFRIPVETIAEIDAWAAQQSDKPSRSEAVRRLLDAGMKALRAKKR
jgi:hypothetical protein